MYKCMHLEKISTIFNIDCSSLGLFLVGKKRKQLIDENLARFFRYAVKVYATDVVPLLWRKFAGNVRNCHDLILRKTHKRFVSLCLYVN